jgi:hypothetical protein
MLEAISAFSHMSPWCGANLRRETILSLLGVLILQENLVWMVWQFTKYVGIERVKTCLMFLHSFLGLSVKDLQRGLLPTLKFLFS